MNATLQEEILGKPLPFTPDDYLQQSHEGSQHHILSQQLLAAHAYLQRGQSSTAHQIVQNISPPIDKLNDPALNQQHHLLLARMALLEKKPEDALSLLNKKSSTIPTENRDFFELKALAYEALNQYFASSIERMNLDETLSEEPEKSRNQYRLWKTLQHFNTTRLEQLKQNIQDPITLGWLSLAACQKDTDNLDALFNDFQTWQTQYPTHPGRYLLQKYLPTISKQKIVQHIALLLPQKGPWKNTALAIQNGFLDAAHSAPSATPPTIEIFDTTSGITNAYTAAIKKGADLLIGPLEKENVDHLFQQYHQFTPVITLNYSHDSQSFDSRIYQLGLSPLDEAEQAAFQAKQHHYLRAIVIAPDNYWGHQVSDHFKQSLIALGGMVIDTYYFNQTNKIEPAIKTLLHITSLPETSKKSDTTSSRRQDLDVFFLAANTQQAQKIVPLLKYYYADNIPIIATATINNGYVREADAQDLEHIYFADIPFLLTPANTHSEYNIESLRFYALGMDAYALSQKLTQLPLLRFFSFQGKTGLITLDAQQRFHRALTWMQMTHGKPHAITPPDTDTNADKSTKENKSTNRTTH